MAGNGLSGQTAAEEAPLRASGNPEVLVDWVACHPDGAAPGVRLDSETPLTSRFQGVVPMSQVYPSEFLELACLYEDALSSAVEARLYKTGYQVSETLLELSLRLGRLHANARDVIELHACGVRAVTNDMNAFKACVFMEEARLMTLELMGNLANFYRNYCMDFTGKRRRE